MLTQLLLPTLEGEPTAPRAWATLLPGKPSVTLLNRFGWRFPDASLEIISIGDTGGGLVAIQWMLHGTHNGPLMDGTRRLPVAKSPIRGLPSFRLKVIRFARSKCTLTRRR